MSKKKTGKTATQLRQEKSAIMQSKKRVFPFDKLIIGAACLLFAAFAFWLLATVYGDYLRKMEALSLFLPTSMFFRDCMSTPAGLLAWLGAYANQFLYSPSLGALILVVLLLFLFFLALKAFAVPVRWRLAAFILPSLVLTCFLRLGYVMFTLKPISSVWALPMGLVAALGLVWAYRSAKTLWLKIPLLFVIVVCGYPLLGFYALLAGILCFAITDWKHIFRVSQWLPALLAVVLVVISPLAWFWLAGGDQMRSQVYFVGLPRFFSYETGMWSFYIITFAVLLVAAVLSFLWVGSTSPNPKKAPYLISTCAFAVSIAIVSIFRYSDRDFMLTLAMDRALWEQDWQRAVDLAQGQKGEPTRLNSVLADIALMRLGQAPEKMFAIKYGYKPYDVERKTRPLHDADGALIAYHLGLINYAYRWNTEYNIEQGMSAQRLMLMVKCALLNYDVNLAKTYLDILYNTPRYRSWAKKHMRYLSNPLEIASDPEMASIKQLMCHRNHFINDKGEFEGYVWPLLAQAEEGTPLFNELSMEAALICTDLDAFMAKLPSYAATRSRIPRHFQEAALLWSMLSNAECPVPIDQDVLASHDQFLNVFRSTAGDEEKAQEQRDRMKGMFGGTYWYYFVFHSDKHLQ